MNILHVAEYYFANPDFVRLGRELAKRNHSLSVVTSIRAVDKPEQTENMKIFEIKPYVTLYKLPHTLTFPFSVIYKIVKRQDVEIMHLLNDLSTNAAFASLISRLTDVPFVYAEDTSPTIIVEAMKLISKNPQVRNKLSIGARKVARRYFSEEISLRQLKKLMHKICADQN